MKTTLLVCAGLLAATFAQAQVVPLFSGRTSLNTSTATVDEALRPQEPRFEVLSGVEWSVEPWRFKLLAGPKSAASEVEWSLREAWASFGEGQPVEAKAGWWTDTAGPALFRSTVPTFTSLAGTEFLATAGDAKARSPFHFRLQGSWDEFSLQATWVPWPESPDLPDTLSPWFPTKDVVNTFTALFDYSRSGPVAMVRASENADQAYLVQARLSSYWGEVTFGGYQGPDSSLAFPASLRLLSSGFTFQFRLQAFQPTVQTGWMTFEVPVGSGKIWAEQSYTKGRLKATPSLEYDSSLGWITQKTRVTDVLETVVGASYSLSFGPWGQVRAWLEGNVQREWNAMTTRAPDFVEGAEVGLHWDHSQGLGSVDVIAGNPWDTAQGWVLSKFTWNWSEGRALWVALPGFWGSPTTTWGQFTDRRLWALGTAWDL